MKTKRQKQITKALERFKWADEFINDGALRLEELGIIKPNGNVDKACYEVAKNIEILRVELGKAIQEDEKTVQLIPDMTKTAKNDNKDNVRKLHT